MPIFSSVRTGRNPGVPRSTKKHVHDCDDAVHRIPAGRRLRPRGRRDELGLGEVADRDLEHIV